jgi:hypothetical protein
MSPSALSGAGSIAWKDPGQEWVSSLAGANRWSLGAKLRRGALLRHRTCEFIASIAARDMRSLLPPRWRFAGWHSRAEQ